MDEVVSPLVAGSNDDGKGRARPGRKAARKVGSVEETIKGLLTIFASL